MKEAWKDTIGFEHLYMISNLGNIFSKTKLKIMRLEVNNYGYKRVGLYKNGIYYNKTVHRLVIEAFYGPSKLQVNHKNGIKSDNRLENLEYCTQKQNNKHAWDTGLSKHMYGENARYVKLTQKEVDEIKLLLKEGRLYQREIAKLYRVSRGTICAIKCNKTWRRK